MKKRAPSSNPVLMKLEDLKEARFLQRENRFVGMAEVAGRRERIHIADPGRLTELLYPGNRLLVRRAPEGSDRRTAWSLMAGSGVSGWVLLNTFLHRKLSEAILMNPSISPFGQLDGLRAEVSHPDFASRFDFLLNPGSSTGTWLEVKGCTLKDGRKALFPDAPTTRGTRHLVELTELVRRGENCAVMFLVFPEGIDCLAPNGDTDPDFRDAFLQAVDSGVEIHPLKLSFDGKNVTYVKNLRVCRPDEQSL
jgi:sugar fermentation stimulation protein A